MGTVPLSVTLIGKGRVGRALAAALRRNGAKVRVFALRQGLPRRVASPDLILICVRDAQIEAVVSWLQGCGLTQRSVVAHVSGATSAEVLQPLRRLCKGIAQCHPFRSVRVGGRSCFQAAYFLASGDAAAMVVLRRFVRLLEAKLVAGKQVDLVKYHLSAALLANGGIALLHAAHDLLADSGIESKIALSMLVDLQRSVLRNVEDIGVEAALTGPVRRGDVGTLRRHLAVLARGGGDTVELYQTLARAQLTLVRGLGELEPLLLTQLERTLGKRIRTKRTR